MTLFDMAASESGVLMFRSVTSENVRFAFASIVLAIRYE